MEIIKLILKKMEINTNNQVVDIDSLQPNEYNPKINYRDSEENRKEFDRLKDSLKIAGQIQPVIVRERENEGRVWYEIINGYHRWEAMKEMGYKEIEIKNLGNISFDIAVSRALLTEDIKIPIDSIELANLMKTLVTEEKPVSYWAELLPYTQEVIEAKIDLLDFDFNQFDEKDKATDKEEKLAYTFVFQSEEKLSKVREFFKEYGETDKSDVLFNMIQREAEDKDDTNISEM